MYAAHAFLLDALLLSLIRILYQHQIPFQHLVHHQYRAGVAIAINAHYARSYQVSSARSQPRNISIRTNSKSNYMFYLALYEALILGDSCIGDLGLNTSVETSHPIPKMHFLIPKCLSHSDHRLNSMSDSSRRHLGMYFNHNHWYFSKRCLIRLLYPQ